MIKSRIVNLLMRVKRFLGIDETFRIDRRYTVKRGSPLFYLSNYRKPALVLLDCWDYIPHLNENLNAIVGMVNACREAGYPIIHSSNGTKQHPALMAKGDIVLSPKRGRIELNSLRYTRLLYAGYYADVCLLIRDTGILSARELCFDVEFIKDASDSCILAHSDVTRLIGANWAKITTIARVTIEANQSEVEL